MKVFVLALICCLCLFGAASGATITLEGSQEIAIVGSTPDPPTTLHFGSYIIPDVYPSNDPQTWSIPVEYLVDPLAFGFGTYSTVVDPFLTGDGEVGPFTPNSIELTLRWWVHTPEHSFHRLEWEATGIEVPEPDTFLLIGTLILICGMYRSV